MWELLAVAGVVLLAGALAAGRRRRAADEPRFLAGAERGWDFDEVGDGLLVCQRAVRHVVPLGNTWLMLEGRLEGPDLSGLETSTEVPSGLSRQTLWSLPREDTVSIRLTSDVVDVVVERLLPSVANLVTHVQIALDGRLVFGAYDWFDFLWVADDLASIVPELEEAGAVSKKTRTP